MVRRVKLNPDVDLEREVREPRLCAIFAYLPYLFLRRQIENSGPEQVRGSEVTRGAFFDARSLTSDKFRPICGCRDNHSQRVAGSKGMGRVKPPSDRHWTLLMASLRWVARQYPLFCPKENRRRGDPGE